MIWYQSEGDDGDSKKRGNLGGCKAAQGWWWGCGQEGGEAMRKTRVRGRGCWEGCAVSKNSGRVQWGKGGVCGDDAGAETHRNRVCAYRSALLLLRSRAKGAEMLHSWTAKWTAFEARNTVEICVCRFHMASLRLKWSLEWSSLALLRFGDRHESFACTQTAFEIYGPFGAERRILRVLGLCAVDLGGVSNIVGPLW